LMSAMILYICATKREPAPWKARPEAAAWGGS
jgi:hypothetical protein